MAVLLLATAAHASHDTWTIVKVKQIAEGTDKACTYHRVERCAGLRAPLPRLARTAGEPCPHDPTRFCLGNGSPYSGGYDPIHDMVILAPDDDWDGDEALRHEFIHYLRCKNGRDCYNHDGPEWTCQ